MVNFEPGGKFSSLGHASHLECSFRLAFFLGGGGCIFPNSVGDTKLSIIYSMLAELSLYKGGDHIMKVLPIKLNANRGNAGLE